MSKPQHSCYDCGCGVIAQDGERPPDQCYSCWSADTDRVFPPMPVVTQGEMWTLVCIAGILMCFWLA